MAVVVLPEPIIPSTKISCAAPTSQGYDAAASLRIAAYWTSNVAMTG
jgi:hypothetical protein